jgi:hypothetical protein
MMELTNLEAEEECIIYQTVCPCEIQAVNIHLTQPPTEAFMFAMVATLMGTETFIKAMYA